jgi:CRISPR-associated protein Cmr2
MDKFNITVSIKIAIAWCLAWGDGEEPSLDRPILIQMRQAMQAGGPVPTAAQPYVALAEDLENLSFPETLAQLQQDHPQFWNNSTAIGLVYGGATKIKQYVFEAPKLQDIRGASALLDRINLVDLPAFFGNPHVEAIEQWLDDQNNFPGLRDALIPELVIYSTGGNILAFCPAAYVDQLANAIEKRYTCETLTANSCAVGDRFRLLELRFGLLQAEIGTTPWLDWYQTHCRHELVQAYFGKPEGIPLQQFEKRKGFNELVTKLAISFNQRRSGHDMLGSNRPSRRYPPMFETHPYLQRDDTERRSAVHKIKGLPGEPWFSDTLARKRIAGQRSKRDSQNTAWFDASAWLNGWQPGELKSWVSKFEDFLVKDPRLANQYNPQAQPLDEASKEARSLREIANASQPEGFVAYIYADGNNMGGYIQKIKTAERYQQFSRVISRGTEEAVYRALAHHLHPHQLKNIDDGETTGRDGKFIHPFEILTIGGDDVMLVVPANQALAIAKTLCEEFERIVLSLDNHLALDLSESRPNQAIHRCHSVETEPSRCQLSMSAGVLITADDTPIYYAENLTSQLLKSAKKKAKTLKKDLNYYGGTIDFLVMKSVTMLSSKVQEFRESGLEVKQGVKLKLYAAPYTLHEIGCLLDTAKALKDSGFPRSQLYQIRSLLAQGKHTAMLNYRYFWSRLQNQQAKQRLKEEFEDVWCQAKTNNGNLVPWMYVEAPKGDQPMSDDRATYETIWRELVDLYPFIPDSDQQEESTLNVQPRTAAEV